jgi:hypothetical protein
MLLLLLPLLLLLLLLLPLLPLLLLPLLLSESCCISKAPAYSGPPFDAQVAGWAAVTQFAGTLPPLLAWGGCTQSLVAGGCAPKTELPIGFGTGRLHPAAAK